jgi:competence protein ComER
MFIPGGIHLNVGFVGTGSMGSILIQAFIQSGALNPEQMLIINRTISKAERLAEQYPGLRVAATPAQLALECQVVFICVKPMEYKSVIDAISPYMTPSHIVVSITSPVLIRHLEELLPCKIVKIIPSISNYVLSGATLFMCNDRVTPEEDLWFENLLSHIGSPIRISEQFTRVSSDLSSCGPAFLAYFVQRFVDAAVDETGISPEEASMLACEMVLGTGKLLTTGGFTPAGLQKRVAVPGGITAEALKVLEQELDEVFHRLIRTTHSKFEEDLGKVEGKLLGQNVE